MKNKRNKIILFLLLTKSLVFADSFAENIELNKEYYELDVASEKMVVIDFRHLQVDDQTILDFVVGAGRSLYVSIFFGASNNAAYTLDAQAHELLGN